MHIFDDIDIKTDSFASKFPLNMAVKGQNM